MVTNEFLGSTIGRLGFGAMRLPTLSENGSSIDRNQVDQMVDAALAAGVNYFDTAFPYHGGQSEIALGASLSRYPRDSYFLATKYPGHQIADAYDPAPLFEEQLRKCGVDYFDFYLLHNVYEASLDVYTDEQWGIADYFVQQKRNGRIRHLGFSSHGRPETLAAFLEYGARKHAQLQADDPQTASLFANRNIMEFCQIQLNYLDWTLQDASSKTALLENAGIPIVVMEPLRGGKLAALPEKVQDRLDAAAPGRSAVEWSFRWLLDIPSVKVILSGMSDMAQVQQNCAIFQNAASLPPSQKETLMSSAESLKTGVPCTGCRYCTDSCPQNIDIPLMLATYNDLQFDASFTVSMQMDAVPKGQRPQDCINCGACTRMCPQGIDVPAALASAATTLQKMPKWADLCRQRAEAAAKLSQDVPKGHT